MECIAEDRAPHASLPSARSDAVGLLQHHRAVTWAAGSGREHAFMAYGLLGCPALAAAVVLLVRRAYEGSLEVLAVRRTRTPYPMLNLARIRRAAARLGADEVHVSIEAGSDEARKALAADLARALVDRRPMRRRRARITCACPRHAPASRRPH